MGTYTKKPLSLYDKKGNKMQALYKKNDPNAPGEELYDINGIKLDGTYSQLYPVDDKDKKLIEII